MLGLFFAGLVAEMLGAGIAIGAADLKPPGYGIYCAIGVVLIVAGASVMFTTMWKNRPSRWPSELP
jgi:hypothetical protein